MNENDIQSRQLTAMNVRGRDRDTPEKQTRQGTTITVAQSVHVESDQVSVLSSQVQTVKRQ